MASSICWTCCIMFVFALFRYNRNPLSAGLPSAVFLARSKPCPYKSSYNDSPVTVGECVARALRVKDVEYAQSAHPLEN